jgi:hypothetical protein
MSIEELDATGVIVNGEYYPNPFYGFRHLWTGPQVWMWNEFVKNPEALAEYFEEGRWPAGAWENKRGARLTYEIKKDFYLKLEYAKRALMIAYDALKIKEEMYNWFLKVWRAYKEPIEKVYPQFDDRNYANPTLLERAADWCANVLANTFVKYGPNAFLILLKGLINIMNVDNEWMEAIKALSGHHPEFLNYEEIREILKKDLPQSDELYIELKNIYQKWKEKYLPKDEMTYARLDVLSKFKELLKAKNYYHVNSKFYKELAESIMETIFQDYPEDEHPELFKELGWAMEYLDWPHPQIAPPDYHVGTDHVKWDYMKYRYRPKMNHEFGL